MPYTNLKNNLIANFKENNFESLFNSKKYYAKTLTIPNDYNLNISLSFPGKLSKQTKYGIKYDYRFQFNGQAITHEDIVRDLNNSIRVNPDIFNELYTLLINLCSEPFIEISDYPDLQNYYNDYTPKFKLEELVTIIPYLVVQEDINFPMPCFDGRRMSFYRYIEALLCTLPNSSMNIEQIVLRTNFKGGSRPAPMKEFTEYYKPIYYINPSLNPLLATSQNQILHI